MDFGGLNHIGCGGLICTGCDAGWSCTHTSGFKGLTVMERGCLQNDKISAFC